MAKTRSERRVFVKKKSLRERDNSENLKEIINIIL
jgi:hypothetical protein